MQKRSFGTRVWIIADKYNIEQTQVNRIINSYVSYCRELILNGYEVTFLDLVTLVPDYLVSDDKMTLAYQCKKVAETCGFSYHTVFSIIKEYLEFIKEDLLSGKSVDIRSIVTLHPLYSEGGNVVTKVHSSISLSIKRDLQLRNGDVSSVRAHTHKLLKYIVRQGAEIA